MVIVISYDEYDTDILDKYNVTIIRPLQMGLDIIANLLDKNVSWPVNIGNREGEIVEVQVLKNSHLIGVKLEAYTPRELEHCADICRRQTPAANGKHPHTHRQQGCSSR